MLWKILFWFETIIFALLLLFSIQDVRWTFVDWLSFIAFALSLAGLYGYVYKKKLWSKKVWQVLLIAIIIFWYLYTFYLDPEFGGYPPKDSSDYIVTALAPLPTFIANFLYLKKLK